MAQTAANLTAQVRDLAERVRALEVGAKVGVSPASLVVPALREHYVASLAGRPAIERIMLDQERGELRVVTFLRGDSAEDEKASYRAEFEFRRACPGSLVEFLTIRFAERERPGLLGSEAVALYERG